MDGILVAWLPSRKWLGVLAPRSDGSAFTGVKGREFSACSTRQKVVFNTSSDLICEATCTEDGVQYPLKTTDQPLPDATLVWRTERIEPPLNALICKFGGNVRRIQFFDAFTELFLRSDEVRTIIRPNHSRRTATGDEPRHSHYTATSVHGRDNFNMDSTSSQTSEQKSPALLGGPTNGDVEWAEVINHGVGKGRRLVCESLLWEVYHDRLNGCCTELSTQDAV